MDPNERSYRPKNVLPNESVNLEDTYVQLESRSWKRPRMLSLENLNGVLSIKVADFADRNVTAVEFVNQNEYPDVPPNSFNVNTRTHIAVDDNYIYVWVPTAKRWKRALLSSWD